VTIVVGQDQEPASLNSYVSLGATRATNNVTSPVLSGMYRVRPDYSYEPVLVDHVRVETKPFALTYHLKSEAEWSDGVPVSADDVLFTLNAIRNPTNDIVSRAGYELIDEATKLDSKTVRLVFSEPYAAWKTLFPQVFPKHVIAGEDFDIAFLDSIPVASGPFRFLSWQRGTQIVLIRNEGWWGAHDAYLDRAVFRFIPSTESLIQALRYGEVQVVEPQAQVYLAELYDAPGIAFEWKPGSFIEHVDFNVDSTAMPLLGEAWFREAVGYALNRQWAVTEAYDFLAPGIEPLGSLTYLIQQSEYKAHFGRYGYDPDRVAKLMKKHGCVRGSDSVWSCGGIRASIRFATTSGNALRELMQERLRAQAAVAGVELIPENSPPSVLFGTRLPAGDYEMVMFTWLREGDPSGLRAAYGCGGPSNFMAYCSEKVTELLEAADRETTEGARAALVNRADAILADDLPSIPLFQRPAFVARATQLVGPTTAAPQSLTWNIEEWRFG
jgi:peptide/nickel transport system substrate-binding protein